MPVPVKLIIAVGFVEELLLTVNWPLIALAVVGAKRTCNVMLCFGFRVSGNSASEMVNPAPVISAVLMVTAAVPVDVSVSGCVDEDPTMTSPKLMAAALTDS